MKTHANKGDSIRAFSKHLINKKNCFLEPEAQVFLLQIRYKPAAQARDLPKS